MGEAKRRKQILGDRYGEIPPVLVEGTPQWEEHIEKFYEAWNDKWQELFNRFGTKEEGEGQSLKEKEIDRVKEDLKNWLWDYLSVYRDKDREQLVAVLMDEHYEELDDLFLEEEISDDSGEADGLSEMAFSWVLLALTYFSIFSPYLSPESANAYAEPLNGFYSTFAADHLPRDEEVFASMTAVFSQSLGSYFQPTPTERTVPDAPLELNSW